jgi:hypothetical protein
MIKEGKTFLKITRKNYEKRDPPAICSMRRSMRLRQYFYNNVQQIVNED